MGQIGYVLKTTSQDVGLNDVNTKMKFNTDDKKLNN